MKHQLWMLFLGFKALTVINRFDQGIKILQVIECLAGFCLKEILHAEVLSLLLPVQQDAYHLSAVKAISRTLAAIRKLYRSGEKLSHRKAKCSLLKSRKPRLVTGCCKYDSTGNRTAEFARSVNPDLLKQTCSSIVSRKEAAYTFLLLSFLICNAGFDHLQLFSKEHCCYSLATLL